MDINHRCNCAHIERIVVWVRGHNGSYYTYHPMESMDVCLKAVAAAELQIANGGDSEGAVALFCVNGKGEQK